MKSLLRWLVANLPLMMLAIVLAVLAWVVAIEEADPTRTERYLQTIPITPIGLPEGMMIVGELDTRAQVTVRVPESVRQSLEPGDFEATVDLTGLGAGTHEVPIHVELAKQPSEITEYTPRHLTLELDYWMDRSVPISVHTEGEPMLGHLTRTLAFTPTLATVSGPSAYVAQVAEATTYVSVEGADVSIEGGFPLQISDAEGDPVTHPDITLTPGTVMVYIPIELSEEYGTLTVRPVRIGQVAFGYRVIDIAAEPPAVNIRGAPEVITALPGYIDTEPIDVEGAQADVIKHPALNVPPYVTLLPGQQVTVTVYIEAIQSSMTMEITPTLQGLDPGFTAAVSPQTVEVFLSGPLPQLETLGSSDVRVVIDLFDLEPGIYPIEPQAVVPPEVTDYSILPATIQVEISVTPTLSPTLSLTPTLTLTPTISPTVSPIPTPTEE